MIFQPVYRKAIGSVTIKGAPSETVTYTGPSSGSVTLDASGNAAVTLMSGEYDFVGSISHLSGILRENIAVRPGGTVTMWPETGKMVYWFGRDGEDDQGNVLSPIFGNNAGTGTNTTDSDADSVFRYMGATVRGGDSGTYLRAKLTYGPFDFTPYSKLSIIGAGASNAGSKFAGYGSSSTSGTTFTGGAEAQPGNSLAEFDISAVTASLYAGVRIAISRVPNERKGAWYGFRAIWFEV